MANGGDNPFSKVPELPRGLPLSQIVTEIRKGAVLISLPFWRFAELRRVKVNRHRQLKTRSRMELRRWRNLYPLFLAFAQLPSSTPKRFRKSESDEEQTTPTSWCDF
jgi:hypothetical protein